MIGTAFGNYLGACYILERQPQPYGLVDFTVFPAWGGWESQCGLPGLFGYDFDVATALINCEWSRFPWRTDILDAEFNAIYEIKPIRSADQGPPQLARYLTALNRFASTALDGVSGRIWTAGGGGDPWDPRRYGIILPGGATGKICVIYAWNDPSNPGLILYDIACCPTSTIQNQAAYLSATQLLQVPAELRSFQPQIQQWIGDRLPLAPTGSMYAVLMPRRFFEAFVLMPRAAKSGRLHQQDRLIQAQYGPQPGPVLTALVAETWILGHVLAGPVADIPMVESGWMSTEDLLRLYAAQAVAGIAAGLVAIPIGAAEAAALAAAVPELEALAEVPELAQVAEDFRAVEEAAGAPETPAGWPGDPPPAPPAPSPFQYGPEAGEATQVGRSLPPWSIDLPPLPPPIPPGAGPPANLGMCVIGAFLIGSVTPDAQAGTGSNPPAGTALLGADRVQLIPIELMTPVTGKVAVEQKVIFGGDTYYVGAIVTASPASGP